MTKGWRIYSCYVQTAMRLLTIIEEKTKVKSAQAERFEVEAG